MLHTKEATMAKYGKSRGNVKQVEKKEYSYENIGFGDLLGVIDEAAHGKDGLTIRVQGKADGEQLSLMFVDNKTKRTFSCRLRNYTEEGIVKLWGVISKDNAEGTEDGFHPFQERKEA
jgi:hypothetical protein